MKKEFDEALVRDFPNLYRQRNGDLHTTAMCWGFECGNGWEPIIRNLSRELEAEILKEPESDRESLCASQVKEKFGTLRFYMHSETEEMSKIIRYYEEKSETTCEECGAKGQLRGGGWLKTTCKEHSNGQKAIKYKKSFSFHFITKWFKYPKFALEDLISSVKWKLYKFRRLLRGI
jgi:hypothetical protein